MNTKSKAEILKEYNLASGRIRDLTARLEDMKERNERCEKRITELLEQIDSIREKDRSNENQLRRDFDDAVHAMAQQRIEIDKNAELNKRLRELLKEIL